MEGIIYIFNVIFSRRFDFNMLNISSVQVIARLIPSQFLSLLMHEGKQLVTLLAVKRLAGVAPEVDLMECTLPLQSNEYGRTHSGLETQRQHHHKSETGVPVDPK